MTDMHKQYRCTFSGTSLPTLLQFVAVPTPGKRSALPELGLEGTSLSISQAEDDPYGCVTRAQDLDSG